MDFVYRFPVVKGIQAKREYYIAMIPLKMIPKLFPQDGEYVPPEYRAQRKLNETRIPVISKYILSNRENYVFSALAASIDGDFKFCPSEHPDVGVLEISMDAKLLINDGQHRKAAIEKALQEAHKSIPTKIDYQQKIITLQNVISALQDPSTGIAEKNKLLKMCIKRITYNREPAERIGGVWHNNPIELNIQLML